jgi:hypothetical protein
MTQTPLVDDPYAGTAAIEDLEWFELVRPAPPDRFDPVPLQAELAEAIAAHAGGARRIAVCAGSRGIARVGEIVAAVVRALQAAGKEVVLVPAMGSHGGATPAGQAGVLHEFGIDAAALGVELDASMAVTRVGSLRSGEGVYLADSVLRCDAVIPVNRVKPHTDFRGPFESGLTKMLVIGLGKEVGASSLHAAGFARFDEVIPEGGEIVLSRLAVPFGVAMLEDAWHRLRRVEVVPGDRIREREPQLLQESWQHFARLPFGEVDVLVLREMGKTVSGSGMDPNVTGRFSAIPLAAPTVVHRLAVLDLREDSGGNAIGVGLADVVTERLRHKIDWPATASNAIASKSLVGAKLPLVAPSDLAALGIAGDSLVGRRIDEAAVAAAVNTLEVFHLAVTAPLVEQARAAGYEEVDGGLPRRAAFLADGTLAGIGGLHFFRAG